MSLKLADHLNAPMEYKRNTEHIHDILKWVDLLLKNELVKQKYHNKSETVQGLMGFVISEDEVFTLLDSDANLKSEYIPAMENDPGAFKELMDMRVNLSALEGVLMPVRHIVETFELNFFEFGCLAICLAIELDVKYEKLYAYLQDDLNKKRPTIDLMLKLLCRNEDERLSALSSFLPGSKLIRYILNTLDYPSDSLFSLSRPLKIDEGVLYYILGFDSIQFSLGKIAQFCEAPANLMHETAFEDDTNSFIKAVINYVSSTSCNIKPLLVHLKGAKGTGKKNLVCNICNELDSSLLIIDSESLVKDADKPDRRLNAIVREAKLRKAVLCIENFHVLQEEANRDWINELLCCIQKDGKITFLLSEYDWKPPNLSHELVLVARELKQPDIPERCSLWDYYAQMYGVKLTEELQAAACKYRLTPGQINNIFGKARNLAFFRSPQRPEITTDDIKAALNSGFKTNPGGRMQKIVSRYCWKDIVLPEYQLLQLKEICSHMQYRYKVYGEWGFDKKLSRGKGLCVLFSGPPGTGKTMAAEVISSELQLELYRIDLSSVISKYIGETEKNINEIFNLASTGNSILFFDEADALFGKRSEVKDAHDRYANIETAFLLQRIEDYEGIAILATNFRDNIDEAFARRLSHHIEFPYPDEEQRRGIWEVVFPENAPIGDDVDFDYLAGKLKLAGGSIKNVAVNSAFYAAEEGTCIKLSHVLKAAKYEYRKISKEWE